MNNSYTAPQIALHWLSAIIIVWALGSGFLVACVELAASTKHLVSFVNVSLTTLLIPFFATRLYLAIRLAKPSPDAPMERLAALAHKALYLLTSAVLVTGVLMMDRDINVFDWISIPAPLDDARLITLFLNIHVWSCVALAILVGLHVAAVCKHQLAGRNVLARMWI